MKKIILSGLILATLGITITSCEKEKIEEVNTTQNQETVLPTPASEDVVTTDNND